MKMSMEVIEDDSFKIVKQNSVIEEVIEKETEKNVMTPKQKIPAPLQNPKGISWFDGTSWGAK
jgi:hypothetical protein